MLGDALDSQVIAEIRAAVPEFEDTFQRAIGDEGPELGEFQAMSEFASWVRSHLEQADSDPAIERSFEVIERVASSGTFPLGTALVVEFVEATADLANARLRMGPKTRTYLPRRLMWKRVTGRALH